MHLQCLPLKIILGDDLYQSVRYLEYHYMSVSSVWKNNQLIQLIFVSWSFFTLKKQVAEKCLESLGIYMGTAQKTMFALELSFGR